LADFVSNHNKLYRPLQEQDMIRRCLKNDRIAQRYLYDRYAPLLMAVCRRYVGLADAEDVMQDSFVRIFNYIGQYRHEGSFEGWLRRVCVNTCIRHLEKAKKLKLDFRSEDLPEQPIAPDALSQLQTNELLGLIDKLPDGYKAVFNLSVIEGFSHKEISDMLGIEESSSRSQLTKARKYMQRSIAALQKIGVYAGEQDV